MNELDRMIESASGPLAAQSTRDNLLTLENHLKAMPQVEIPVIHRYSGGIYAREITIPAGVMLTGTIYKDDHFDVMVYGDVTVTGEDGRKRLTGFNIVKGNQGKKRAGYTHAETRWITFCSSPEMATDDYIGSLTVESFADLVLTNDWIEEADIKNAFESQISYRTSDYKSFRIGYLAASSKKLKTDVDRDDYHNAITEFGFTEDVVRMQSECLETQIESQVDIEGFDAVSVQDSGIEGKGLFSNEGFSPGDIIMPARIGGLRTIAGRYTNHAVNPNAKMVIEGDNINLVAIKNIGIEEITTDYRATLLSQNIKKGL